MRIGILDAWHPDDPALVNSHWVAEQTIDTLERSDPAAIVDPFDGEGLHLATAVLMLSQTHEGFVFCGHGRDHDLCFGKDERGDPITLIGREEIKSIGPRWFHAFACWSGRSLCHDAANAGVDAYLGYHVAVNLEWDVSILPGTLRVLLADLVTVATLALAQGERSRDVIRRRVRAASDRLVEWIDMNDAACTPIPWIELTGLQVLATLLHRDLDLEGASVVV